MHSVRLKPHRDARASVEPAALAGRAIFLHTAWRSGGTWLWSRCRDSKRVRAFYEPLHEQMASLRHADIGTLRPQSWHSNHSETAPYFQEYRPLLRTGGHGVSAYQARFALDDFFLGPEAPDAALEDYVGRLLRVAAGEGRVAVLKFCRSLGRVGWFERHFPDALHAVVLRDPVSQWRSSRRLLVEQRNRYFTVAPLLVLARNSRDPVVQDAMSALGVRLPRLHSDDMAYGIETLWHHARRLDDAARYRAFLAFWTSCAIAALQSSALVIDTGDIAADPAHRAAVQSALQTYVGESIPLQPRTAPPGAEAPGVADIADAHLAAAEMVRGYGDLLAPERAGLILAKLGAGWRGTGVRMVRRPEMAGLPRPSDLVPRSARQKLFTGAMVLAARALQPLRRLHGSFLQRMAGGR